MLFDRFFKPKWQHPDPEARKQALQTLKSDDPLLGELARADQDPGLRRNALSRIGDLETMLQAFTDDNDAGVRDYAKARLQKLLTGREPDSPLLEQRLVFLANLKAYPDLIEFLAIHSAEPELRLAALADIDNDRLRGEIATTDLAAQVRLAALETIQAPAVLQQVAKKMRNRDKRISKMARTRLQSLQTEQHQQQQIMDLCSAMENLHWDGETGPSAAYFSKLEKQWQEISERADALQKRRFEQARERFSENFRSSAARRAARIKLCDELTQLQTLLQREPETLDEHEMTDVLQRIQGEWDAIDDSNDIETRRLQRQFSQSLRNVQEHLLRTERDRHRIAQQRSLLDTGEKLLHQSGQISAQAVKQFEKRWRETPAPQTEAKRLQLQREFETALEKLRNRLQRQSQIKDQELDEITALLKRLDEALEVGELQQAIALYEQSQQRLKNNIGVTRQQMARFSNHLQDSASTIARLRGWRRWGTNQARENLCEEVENLAGAALEPAELARQVQSLRIAWKSLDSAEGAAPRALWKRFNDACEKAYAPAQAHFDAQAQQRRINFEQRQDCCQRIEQFEAETDWEQQVDWREVSRFVRDMPKEWRKLGPVDRGKQKAIDQRYNEALAKLRQRVKPQLEKDLKRRKELIQRVEQLLETEDLQSAIEEVKRMQSQWKPQILGPPRQEQALWKKFRAACDAVFERRQAEQQALDSERQANLEQKTEISETIEAVLLGDTLLDKQTVEQAYSQFRQLQQQWEALGPVPRAAGKSSERCFAAACEKFERSYDKQQRLRARADLDSLRLRADLCRELELRLLDDNIHESATGPVLEQARRRWQALPGLQKNDWEQPLQRRFEQVCLALASGADACQLLRRQLIGQTADKQSLCIRMEILAKVETPSEFAQARMEYQVSRLSETLSERGTRPQYDQAEDMERQWYALACLSDRQEDLQTLEKRFCDALSALTAETD